MPVRIISWNIFKGDVNKITPIERFNNIINLGFTHSIHIIFLQEHPKSTSKLVGEEGRLMNNNEEYGTQIFTHDGTLYYNYYVIDEADSGGAAYAILILNQEANNIERFLPDYFQNSLGTPLRCPILLRCGGYNFLNWHNEANGLIKKNIENLLNAIQTELGWHNLVLVGDFNITDKYVNKSFDNNYNNISYSDYAVDHIITTLNCKPILEDELAVQYEDNSYVFKSDSNHYAIAAVIE